MFMYKHTFSIAALCGFLFLPIAGAASEFSKQELERNIAITTDSCVKKQKNDPANDYFSGFQIKEVCECYAKQFYSLITKDELEYSNKNRTLDNLKGKPRQAEEYCKSMLAKKWSQSTASNKAEYIALFKSGVFSTCQKGMTEGNDSIPISIAKPVCQCYTDDLSGKLTIEQMRDSDKNPNKYASLAEKTMTNCFNKVISVNK